MLKEDEKAWEDGRSAPLVRKCRRPCDDGFATAFMEAKEGHDLTYSNNAFGVTEEGRVYS
jgi:hypothetical protein